MSKYDLSNMEYQHFLNIFADILNKHAPMKHFANLDTKSVTDNIKFWHTVKPHFPNKVKAKNSYQISSK